MYSHISHKYPKKFHLFGKKNCESKPIKRWNMKNMLMLLNITNELKLNSSLLDSKYLTIYSNHQLFIEELLVSSTPFHLWTNENSYYCTPLKENIEIQLYFYSLICFIIMYGTYMFKIGLIVCNIKISGKAQPDRPPRKWYESNFLRRNCAAAPRPP